ncbi:hypothetical protein [Haloferula sp. BvORR071]|uniref:hypothetical protein n=1 Tax=Haloferula sp. BvORR071 TaxID=1396141 RepID=UPI00054E0FCF|nr:hypothetical protein [Haloferula sp. BvORR071]
MPYPVTCPAPVAEAEKALATVQRVNQRWIVHGKLRENASAYLTHLEQTDPVRLQRSCELALHLVHHKKAVLLRDPKPLFYAGLFAFATRAEIERYISGHPMTRAISLLLHKDRSGLSVLSYSGMTLAESIAEEIRAVEADLEAVI